MKSHAHPFNRRSLVKGTAWAAPIALASSSIPAYAASQCDSDVQANSQVKIYDGTAGRTGQSIYTWINFGDFEITIPKDRTVVSVTSQIWLQKHSGTNDGSRLGVLSPSNTNMKYYPSTNGSRGSLTSVGTNTQNLSFWNFSDNLRINPGAPIGPGYPFSYLGESTQTWADGSSGTAWGVETTWTPGDSRGTYISESGACKTFSIDQFGGIQWVGQNTYVPFNREIPNWRIWKVTLDDGTVLEGRYTRDWAGDPNYQG